MASGISSTFRQVGIATGIALLGTLFSSKVHDEVLARVAAVPGLSRQGPQIATAVQSGEIGHVIGQLPAPARQAVGVITRTAFTTGLDRILLVAAIIALASGVVSLAAIRSKDFARAAPGGQEGPPEMRRPGRPGTQAGSGRVAATATVAAARAADRPGLPDDTQVTRRLPGTSWHEPYGYAHPERHFKEAPMSATSPAQLSYDVFVSDGPAGASTGDRPTAVQFSSDYSGPPDSLET